MHSIQATHHSIRQTYTLQPCNTITSYATEVITTINQFPTDSCQILLDSLECNKQGLQNPSCLQELFYLLRDRMIFTKSLDLDQSDFKKAQQTLLYAELTMLFRLHETANQFKEELLTSIYTKDSTLAGSTREYLTHYHKDLEQNLLVSKELISYFVDGYIHCSHEENEKIIHLRSKINLNYEDIDTFTTLIDKKEFQSHQSLFRMIQTSKIYSLKNEIEKHHHQSVFSLFLHEKCIELIDSLKSHILEFSELSYSKIMRFISNNLEVFFDLDYLLNSDLYLKRYLICNYAKLLIDFQFDEIFDYGKIYYNQQINELCSNQLSSLEDIDELNLLLFLYVELDPNCLPGINKIRVLIKQSMIEALENLKVDPIHPKKKLECIYELTCEKESIEIKSDLPDQLPFTQKCLDFCNKIEINYGEIWKRSEIEMIKLYQSLKMKLSSVDRKISSMETETISALLLEEKEALEEEIETIFYDESLYQIDVRLIDNANQDHADELLSVDSYVKKNQKYILNSDESPEKILGNELVDIISSTTSLNDQDTYQLVSNFILKLNHFDQLVKNDSGPSSIAVVREQIKLWKKMIDCSENSDHLQESFKKNINTLTKRAKKRKIDISEKFYLFRKKEYNCFLNSCIPPYIRYLNAMQNTSSGRTHFGYNTIATFESFEQKGTKPPLEILKLQNSQMIFKG